jgi:hypothetical protein
VPATLNMAKCRGEKVAHSVVVERIEATLSLPLNGYKRVLSQYSKLMRDSGLLHVEQRGDLANRERTA